MSSDTARVVEEFSGCVYESPTPDGAERDWRVDPQTGKTFPFDLSVSEIKGMNLRDIPMKIEHTIEGFDRGDEVGRVLESVTDPATGYTAIRFGLHDTLAGRTISRLIKSGTLDSLSLGHMYDTTGGTVTPSEVSVCFNGARSGSKLFKDNKKYQEIKSDILQKISQMDSKEVAPAAVNEPVPETNGASPQSGNDLVAAALGAGTTGTPNDGATTKPKDLVDLLESVTSVPGVDQTLATELFKQVADIVTERKSHADQYEKQQRVIAELEKQVESISEKNKTDARKVADCMRALLAEYVGDVDFNPSSTDGDSVLKEVAMQVPVLASALSAHKSASVKVDSLAALRTDLAAEIKKALSPSPWKEEHAPEQRETRQVLVNASARERAPQQAERPNKQTRFAGLTPGQQAALSGFNSFGDGTAPRVTPDMLPSNFNGMKR